MKKLSKYCLSISGPDFEQCSQQLQLSEFVELRLDLYSLSEEELVSLLKTPKDYIATCRIEDEKTSITLLKKAIELGANFIDVDIRRTESFINELREYSSRYDCKLIISYHNYKTTPAKEELLSIYDRGISFGADIMKLATFVNSESDNSILLGLYSICDNLVAFGMGELGKISRLASLYCGAQFTYVSASSTSTTASGQYSYSEMKNIISAINQEQDKPISLIGFMGVGKTTVGDAFAKQSKIKFIDIDQEIEKQTSQSISSIFETKGEDYFRSLESKTLQDVTTNPSSVISCGGGVITREENRIILQEKTICIWLKADVEYCLNQIEGNNRPLLEVNDPLKKAQDLYKSREAFYKEVSHIVINVKGKSIAQICKIINEKINKPL
ncbi:hypothetical protein DNU06_16950 [Putridiphycobacter roseus]|uniref:Multifunctional fusion protein n=1 Tax=Putridiphycobacter roseus TaxID=2219161 RepID=A0A2W1MU92_9FLAO|nr:type I 3-dehydroquinate dehydratase [Putridiphycobacter roseus]PZE15659.1 hypothetical protein DNU06_16950 [Putridiphycobacter roseus]